MTTDADKAQALKPLAFDLKMIMFWLNVNLSERRSYYGPEYLLAG